MDIIAKWKRVDCSHSHCFAQILVIIYKPLFKRERCPRVWIRAASATATIVGVTEVRRNNPLNDPGEGRKYFLIKRREMTGVDRGCQRILCGTVAVADSSHFVERHSIA